jgi:hypothetical protein
MVDYLMVGAVGALVGLGELVSRYKDAPERALLYSPSAWFYCLINGVVALVALHPLVGIRH